MPIERVDMGHRTCWMTRYHNGTAICHRFQDQCERVSRGWGTTHDWLP